MPTLIPWRSKREAILAAAIPLPRELATPPVIKIYFFEEESVFIKTRSLSNNEANGQLGQQKTTKKNEKKGKREKSI